MVFCDTELGKESLAINLFYNPCLHSPSMTSQPLSTKTRLWRSTSLAPIELSCAGALSSLNSSLQLPLR